MAGVNQDQEENADNEERPHVERKQEEARDRAHEDRAMPGDFGGRLGDLDEALENQEYPTTTDELVEAFGNYYIETQHGTESFEDVLASADNQTFDFADDVRSRVLGLIHC